MGIASKGSGELRKFGLTMAVPLLAIGALLLWRERSLWPYLMALAGLFALSALLCPRVLSPVERGWTAFGHGMSVVVTHVILTLTFYLVITPVGLLMRIVGRDPMNRKFDPDARSYWTPIDPDGSVSRPDKPF